MQSSKFAYLQLSLPLAKNVQRYRKHSLTILISFQAHNNGKVHKIYGKQL
ncbi:unnamed protein product [Paramecium octaurelia]|uniref:Uncharacterized protein n=1 Tax=Paramecium octaurelia TaxID=43137 RepID=A0A8S1YCF6_PAROT|nr:unnamed protein product [Paramecium octaurelia]